MAMPIRVDPLLDAALLLCCPLPKTKALVANKIATTILIFFMRKPPPFFLWNIRPITVKIVSGDCISRLSFIA
jgi:hypothetical protein